MFSDPQLFDLLVRAVSEPGTISTAYTAFHGDSIGNQLLALMQCAERGIEPDRSPRSRAGRRRAAT
jgi:hypothetical protein